MNKKIIIPIITVILIVITVVICNQLIFTNKRSCEKESGIWLKYEELCNPATLDMGKECFDSNECEGYCLPKLSETEKKLFEKGEVIYTNGKCGAYKFGVGGCRAYVENGKVDPNRILCIN
ncbi:MAG: hypothetical protein U9O66_02505 [Patescibacteria group bacterium]|nr:hypothetical protein [Patescibacteria group bacterium]